MLLDFLFFQDQASVEMWDSENEDECEKTCQIPQWWVVKSCFQLSSVTMVVIHGCWFIRQTGLHARKNQLPRGCLFSKMGRLIRQVFHSADDFVLRTPYSKSPRKSGSYIVWSTKTPYALCWKIACSHIGKGHEPSYIETMWNDYLTDVLTHINPLDFQLWKLVIREMTNRGDHRNVLRVAWDAASPASSVSLSADMSATGHLAEQAFAVALQHSHPGGTSNKNSFG